MNFTRFTPNRVVRLALVLAALIFPARMAYALTIELEADLSGANEIPPAASPGMGHATVTLDLFAHTMEVNATFSDLIGNTTAAHIHCCRPQPANVGVATTVPTFPGFPLGVDSGTYSHTFDLLAASTYNPAFLTAHNLTVAGAEALLVGGTLTGQSYFNIHTTAFPGGEIRGILAIPEPEVYAMLVAGLGLLGFVARRKKRLQQVSAA